MSLPAHTIPTRSPWKEPNHGYHDPVLDIARQCDRLLHDGDVVHIVLDGEIGNDPVTALCGVECAAEDAHYGRRTEPECQACGIEADRITAMEKQFDA